MIRSFLLLAFAFGFNLAFSQCNDYYEMKEGTDWEMESYNAKGKVTGKIKQTVTAFSQVSNGYTATIHSLLSDDKGKKVNEGDLNYTCKDGVMSIDMKNYLNEEQMKAFGNYTMTVESKNLEFPKSLSVGQTLNDGSITVTASDAPMAMSMVMNITDRKVIGKESITTPAGTFECYKITSTITTSMKMGIAINSEFTSAEWIAPKVAVVKSETYKKGKLQGYTLLTAHN